MLFVNHDKVLHLVNAPNYNWYFFLVLLNSWHSMQIIFDTNHHSWYFSFRKKIMVVRGVLNTPHPQIRIMIRIWASQRFDFATISFQYFTLFLPLLRVYDTACL